MFEPVGCGARRAGVVLLVALASCATAREASLPDEEQLPDAGAGGSGASAGKVGAAGSSTAGKSSGSSGAPSSAGAPTTGGAPSTGGAAGANTAGAHTGGNAGSGAGGGSAGSRAGGSSAGSGAGGGSAGGGTAGSGAAGGGSAGASGSVIFSDDFEDGNANGWTTTAGTWAVATDGSKVYAQSGTGTGSTVLMSTAGTTTWTDQIIEAKVKVKAFGGSSTSYLAAIYGRRTGTSYYALALRQDGKIAIRVGNSTLGSAVAAGIVEGTWYTARLEIVGSTLKAYINGTLTDTESDSSLTAGGIGVGTVNTTAEFDNVKVSLP